MPGRHAIPLSLHLLGGNKSHLTRAEIDAREKSEIRFGGYDFKPTRRLRDNKTALKKWREIIKLYTDGQIDFVTTSDAGLLERYCLTFAEYYNLLGVRKEIEARGWDIVKTYHAVDELGLDSSINKKLDLLIKMEDRMFLTPLSKVRNVTSAGRDKPAADPLEAAGFGNV
jgi:phage terminase small subunit